MDLSTFKAITLAPTPVKIEQLSETLYVRCMTIGAQVAYSEAIQTCEDHTWVFILLRFCLCDQDGALLFPDDPATLQDDIKILAAKPKLIINPLFDAALKANGMKFKEDSKEESSASPPQSS